MFEARNPTYRGPERRNKPRRGDSDRRETIRFEPGNDDRRQMVGRREDDVAAHVWQSELS